ncbi:MAG: SUMF1/EgtB/PvdO family nonheme iron enzyme [Candidatus Sumerlaeia bacterium]|nr:SUMF1/EgtB/PvdO family nonheme iron enzyme [Candidatus Sumerlaeia bacterium]
MKSLRSLSLLAALALPAALFAQPVVSNVAFVQQPDGAGSTRVRVNYDLASPNGNATVSLLYSTNGGTSFSAATTTTGAVGAGVTPGTGKTIDWAVATDLPGLQLAGNFVVRVFAEDGAPIPLEITSNGGAVHQLGTQVLTFTFAEPVTGFDAADVTVTNGTKGAFAGSGAVYTLEVTSPGGAVTAAVPGGAATSVASGVATLGDTLSNFYQDTWTVTLRTTPSLVTMDLIRIPAGTFEMGSPATELSRAGDETQHTVTLSQDFYLGKTEVTQQQWLAIRGSFTLGQAHGTNDNLAVHFVSHDDIMNPLTGLMKLLNDHLTATSQGPATATLPTESQWEYACRAGTTTRFSFGDGLHPTDDEGCGTTTERTGNMWYCGNNSPTGTKIVGQKPANAWGLWDMHGNLSEWCSDWADAYPGTVTDPTGPASGSFRIFRGGNWNNNARDCRSARRNDFSPSIRSTSIGFRVLAVR